VLGIGNARNRVLVTEKSRKCVLDLRNARYVLWLWLVVLRDQDSDSGSIEMMQAQNEQIVRLVELAQKAGGR
jgi:hypothetical protein